MSIKSRAPKWLMDSPRLHRVLTGEETLTDGEIEELSAILGIDPPK